MTVEFERTDFASVPGWAEDDHCAALEAYSRSLEVSLSRQNVASGSIHSQLSAALQTASASAARSFFEQNFVPHHVRNAAGQGLVTGYYEPHLKASRSPSTKFPHPIYRRPPDLVNLVDEAMRGARNGVLTHARQTATGATEPFPTREAIDNGALAGRGLEFAWVASQVELFFLHVQGSGVLSFPDGSEVRIGYDGKNGHPYRSIARHLIDSGLFSFEELTMPVLSRWLEADPGRARTTLWINPSYIFFREREAASAGPLGIEGVTLMPGRSLAVDGSFHSVGTPIYVVAPDLPDAETGQGFRRLMVAHDAGSAIQGAERGDIYFGSGAAAGEMAGTTKNASHFIVLKARWELGGTSRRDR